MSVVEEIKRALRRLTTEEQEQIIQWLEHYGGDPLTNNRPH